MASFLCFVLKLLFVLMNAVIEINTEKKYRKFLERVIMLQSYTSVRSEEKG